MGVEERVMIIHTLAKKWGGGGKRIVICDHIYLCKKSGGANPTPGSDAYALISWSDITSSPNCLFNDILIPLYVKNKY